MGFLSKAWKGVKKAVKKVAKGAKKLAKRIVTATPWGEKLWKEGGRLGTKIMKGIGKVTNALGPVGMIALSVLMPYAAPLWSAFGAAAGAAGGMMGTIGTAIYNGANWVGATLGSMTSGISKGIGQLTSGNFAAAGNAATKGFVDAFTGKAGAAGVEAGVQAAAQSAASQAAGNSIWKQTTDKIMGDVGSTQTDYEKLNTKINADQSNIKQWDPLNPKAQQSPIQMSTGTMNTTGVDSSGVMAPVAAKAQGSSLLSKAGDIAKAMTAGSNEDLGYTAAPIASVGRGPLQSGNAAAGGSTGSGGGSFLSQTMLNAVQQQQQRMSRGFS